MVHSCSYIQWSGALLCCSNRMRSSWCSFPLFWSLSFFLLPLKPDSYVRRSFRWNRKVWDVLVYSLGRKESNRVVVSGYLSLSIKNCFLTGTKKNWNRKRCRVKTFVIFYLSTSTEILNSELGCTRSGSATANISYGIVSRYTWIKFPWVKKIQHVHSCSMWRKIYIAVIPLAEKSSYDICRYM